MTESTRTNIADLLALHVPSQVLNSAALVIRIEARRTLWPQRAKIGGWKVPRQCLLLLHGSHVFKATDNRRCEP